MRKIHFELVVVKLLTAKANDLILSVYMQIYKLSTTQLTQVRMAHPTKEGEEGWLDQRERKALRH